MPSTAIEEIRRMPTPPTPPEVIAPTKLCQQCGAQAQTFDAKCPNCGKPYKAKKPRTVLKVMLGVALVGCVFIVGCVALIGGAANEASKSITKEQNSNAITNSQARSVKLGTTRRDVESRFGKPKSTQESTNQGLGSDSCIYYNIKNGQLLDSWQFCFQGKGLSATLRSKNRL